MLRLHELSGSFAAAAGGARCPIWPSTLVDLAADVWSYSAGSMATLGRHHRTRCSCWGHITHDRWTSSQDDGLSPRNAVYKPQPLIAAATPYARISRSNGRLASPISPWSLAAPVHGM